MLLKKKIYTQVEMDGVLKKGTSHLPNVNTF